MLTKPQRQVLKVLGDERCNLPGWSALHEVCHHMPARHRRTPSAVRQMLVRLRRDGFVRADKLTVGEYRPRTMWALTAKGRKALEA